MTRWTFTSESVSEGHPDKMADQISDAILDEMLAQDPMSRVACETLVTTGLAVVAGEITTEAYVDIPGTVRRTINEIGYNNEAFGYDGNTCGVMVTLDEQSPDISQGVTASEEVRSGQSEEDELDTQGAGDHVTAIRVVANVPLAAQVSGMTWPCACYGGFTVEISHSFRSL